MAKNTAPAKTARKPRVNAVNKPEIAQPQAEQPKVETPVEIKLNAKTKKLLTVLLQLVDGPNTPASAVSEIADFVNATPAVQLPDITAILNSGHSASEKVERLRQIVRSKI